MLRAATIALVLSLELFLSISKSDWLFGQGVEYQRDWSRETVYERTLQPVAVAGESNRAIDGLGGKVLCGYQGWFTCPSDGSGRGWHHWGGRRGFRPGSCTIDLWPDVSELDEDERYATEFQHADGRRAEVYSPLNAKTVDRHFRWMKEHGIDGVFVQRFGTEIRSSQGLFHFNRVLTNCRDAANRHGRVWAVMYDLSGLREGETESIKQDWKELCDRMKLGRKGEDSAYLRVNDKPLVAVWGVGFSDNRRYTLDECASLVQFLKSDPVYGGNAVMLGVPSYWRTLRRDAVADPRLHEIIQSADIISPWAVGRYGNGQQVKRYAEEVWQGDLAWCAEKGLEYLPVVFPGFSWHNMNQRSPLGQIPRRGGDFLWEQFVAVKQSGAKSVYVAMFDEMDEGTAIFKCSQDPPSGASQFLDFEGKPSDFYLWLTGQGGRLIRGEIDLSGRLPTPSRANNREGSQSENSGQ